MPFFPPPGCLNECLLFFFRSLPNKKKEGKVPKKIHKAEREKLKRDQLNELFLELDHALGKFSVKHFHFEVYGSSSS